MTRLAAHEQTAYETHQVERDADAEQSAAVEREALAMVEAFESEANGSCRHQRDDGQPCGAAPLPCPEHGWA